MTEILFHTEQEGKRVKVTAKDNHGVELGIYFEESADEARNVRVREEALRAVRDAVELANVIYDLVDGKEPSGRWVIPSEKRDREMYMQSLRDFAKKNNLISDFSNLV